MFKCFRFLVLASLLVERFLDYLYDICEWSFLWSLENNVVFVFFFCRVIEKLEKKISMLIIRIKIYFYDIILFIVIENLEKNFAFRN